MSLFKKESEDIVFIGEVFCCTYSCGNYMRSPCHLYDVKSSRIKWEKFTEEDINGWKSHDDFIHIWGDCHKKENVFFYDDVYKPLRNKIEARIRK